MKFIDMHCDTISKLQEKTRNGKSEELRENQLQLDLKRMKAVGYLMQTFALFVDQKETENSFESCMELVDRFYEEMDENRDWICPVISYQQILENQKNEIMSALLSIEEGACCKGNLRFLRDFYRLGVRMMTLTWNYENELAYPNRELGRAHFSHGVPETEYGLTEKGLEFLNEMERLGMIIDVSHLGDAGFYGVCQAATKPFIASHSNSRSICNHVRNLTDDMIRRLSERGGVIGINFSADFTEYLSDGTAKGSIEGLIHHMRHIANIGGVQCIGLGTDFDGIKRNIEMDHCGMMPLLAEAMKKGGFSESEVDAICYQNVLRVIQEVL